MLTKNQTITDQFIRFVSEYAYHYTGQEKPTLEFYVDYRDEVSSSTMEQIFANAKKYKINLMEVLLDWCENERWFDESPVDFYYHLDNFRHENPEYDEILDDEILKNELMDAFYDHFYFDYNIEQLLKNSHPEDLTLYFGGSYWDDCYNENSIFQKIDQYETDEITDEFLNNCENTRIGWLIKTQGYQVKDLYDQEKRAKSKFLQSIFEELYEYRNGLECMQLIAIPDSTDWEAIYQLYNDKKDVVIKAGTYFGLFNSSYGSGSGLGIEIEKDILIDEQSKLYKVEVARKNRSYDYSPDPVYGLCRSSKEQIEMVEK